MNIERALRQAVSPGLMERSQKKPSPARVAVSAFYSNRHSPMQDVKSQCNWHLVTPFRGYVTNRLPLCSAER